MKFYNVKGEEQKPPKEYGWRPAVYGVLVKDKKLLIIQPNWDDKYCLPGGSIDLGETPIESLKREFLEETGCSVKIATQPIFVDSHLFANPEKEKYFQRISIYYNIELISENQSKDLDKESTAVVWKNLDEISSDDFTYFQRELLGVILKK
ncbi:MAG: NUDIX domain-containing protein [bacterium]